MPGSAGHDGINVAVFSISTHNLRMYAAFVYIMANRKDGVLYIGVTSDLMRRVFEHRSGTVDGFTKRYGLKTLVWFEAHDDLRAAIACEKTLKHFTRAKKVRLIHETNPDWRDLWPDICK